MNVAGTEIEGAPEAERELLRVAERLFWWESPARALADRRRFTAQVMNLGSWSDICTVQKYWGEGVFDDVLEHAPAGVWTTRRWNYWHVRRGRMPVPPIPRRFGP
jgi:hypothetical protein